MKFVELFAGIGGFRYGLERVCLENEKQKREGTGDKGRPCRKRTDKRKHRFTCVYANEWDKYAASVYRRNYGEIDTRDITTVPAEEIPDHDLLVGGFPCQAFSIAGKRHGFKDTRGTLFFDVARILSEKRPRYLLLENVKGLLSHDGGKTFQTILGILPDLGYQVEWQVFNSKHFGVPQNRERVFIVGHLGGRGGRKILPIGQGSQAINGVQGQSVNTLTTGETHTVGSYIVENGLKKLTSGQSQAERIYDPSGISQTLSSEGGGLGAKTGLYRVHSLQSRNPEGVEIESRIRRLTPKECERLQGFPDDWTKYGIMDGKEYEVSDTQRYKMLGNAVTTNVITAIAEELWRGHRTL